MQEQTLVDAIRAGVREGIREFFAPALAVVMALRRFWARRMR